MNERERQQHRRNVLADIEAAHGALDKYVNPPRRWYHRFPPGSWWWTWWHHA
jgi:hypothetical protein